jgi:hypothetical protein
MVQRLRACSERDVVQDLQGQHLHSRGTFFIWEGGEWKHRFTEEEKEIFMPDVPYKEFVKTQRGS